MTKLLNGAYITGVGQLNGNDIATENYVDAAIAALSFDNVVESGEASLAAYIAAHGTGLAEGTLLILASAPAGSQRFVRRDYTTSDDGTANDFINISGTAVADGSITAAKLDPTVLAAFGDAVGKVLQINGDGEETDFVLTHNADTKDIIVSVRDLTDDELVMPTVKATTVNTITVSFAVAPADGKQYRVAVNRVKYGVV